MIKRRIAKIAKKRVLPPRLATFLPPREKWPERGPPKVRRIISKRQKDFTLVKGIFQLRTPKSPATRPRTLGSLFFWTASTSPRRASARRTTPTRRAATAPSTRDASTTRRRPAARRAATTRRAASSPTASGPAAA